MADSNPKISVIMSVYNGERYVREAINSILKAKGVFFYANQGKS